MNTPRDLSRFYVRTLALSASVTVLACVLASHLVYNWTESLPLGFYWLTRGGAPARGKLVAFPIPVGVRQLVHARRYLPDGAYLVKPVVALAGDRVCTHDGAFTVNGQNVGHVLTEDGAGRPLPHPDVCETVRPGELYVASHYPRSFDSRTFGPVNLADVQGKVTPLWTF